MHTRLLHLLSIALLSLVGVAALNQPCISAAITPETICGYLNSDSKRTNIPGGYLKKMDKKANKFIFAFGPILTVGLLPQSTFGTNRTSYSLWCVCSHLAKPLKQDRQSMTNLES